MWRQDREPRGKGWSSLEKARRSWHTDKRLGRQGSIRFRTREE
jgi:hypothetical protein